MRAGRKRKPGARTPTGRLKRTAAPVTDRGTAEVQARRRGLSGETDNPLPALVRDGAITNVQAEAAEIFARAYVRLWGQPAAPAARYEQYIKGERSEPRDQARLTDSYQSARAALLSLGAGEGASAERAVRIVALEWKPPAPSMHAALRAGLDALARHYRMGR